MRSLCWALWAHYDWHPHKKEKCGHRVRYVQREDNVNTQGECHLQGMPKMASMSPEAKREAWNGFSLKALRRNQLCWHVAFEILDARAMRLYVLLLKPPSMWYFAMAAPGNGSSQFHIFCYPYRERKEREKAIISIWISQKISTWGFPQSTGDTQRSVSHQQQ